jgi:hypothetical protein
VRPAHPVEQGELSLALAGAELIDLLAAGAATLDGDRIRPAGAATVTDDRLLEQARAALVREEPYESVEDWLWRRGRALAPAYGAALKEDGLLGRDRPRRLPFRSGRTVPADSPDLLRARERRTSGEPVLTALMTVTGLTGTRPEDATGTARVIGEAEAAVTTVLTAVDDAVTELKAVRQRRDVEQAAFDNIWRGY